MNKLNSRLRQPQTRHTCNNHLCLDCLTDKNVKPISRKLEEGKVYQCSNCNDKMLYTRPNPRHILNHSDLKVGKWVEIKLN